MNINCPHCTAYLTVPEQYAGQLMKCPKCNSNFTVPALPAIDHEPAFAMAPIAPAPAPTPPAPAPSMAPSIPLAPEVPAFQLAPPEPAFNLAPPPAPTPSPAPTPAPTPKAKTPGAPPPSSPGTGAHALPIPLSRSALQWVPIGAAVLLFILQFFPWVGVFPGGVPAVTQSAWGAAFGDYSTPVSDMREMLTIVTESNPKTVAEAPSSIPTLAVAEPNKSPLLIFYLVPFFLVTLVASIAVAVLPYVHVQLPPAVANLLPWKWGILAVLNAVLLLFLVLQLLLNFGFETSVKEAARTKALSVVTGKPILDKEKAPDLTTTEGTKFEAIQGIYAHWFARTIWLKLALLLHVLATLAAATVYWMEKRGTEHVRFETGVRW